MISFTRLSQKLSAINRKTWIWISLVLAAIAATQSFYIQEMLAALTLFSVLFVCIYAAVFAIFLFVRACKPVIAWAAPRLGKLTNLGVDALRDVIASPLWARAASYRPRREQFLVRARKPVIAWAAPKVSRLARQGVGAFKDVIASPVWARAASYRPRREQFLVRARKPVIAWAAPKVSRLARQGVGAFKDVTASPAWARAVPHRSQSQELFVRGRNRVIAWAAPYRSQSQQLKRNVLTNIARVRSAARKPTHVYMAQVYMVGLRAGVVVVAFGSSLQRTVSTRLAPWLREPVTFRPLASARSAGHLFFRIGRIASRHSRVFSRRPPKKIARN